MNEKERVLGSKMDEKKKLLGSQFDQRNKVKKGFNPMPIPRLGGEKLETVLSS